MQIRDAYDIKSCFVDVTSLCDYLDDISSAEASASARPSQSTNTDHFLTSTRLVDNLELNSTFPKSERSSPVPLVPQENERFLAHTEICIDFGSALVKHCETNLRQLCSLVHQKTLQGDAPCGSIKMTVIEPDEIDSDSDSGKHSLKHSRHRKQRQDMQTEHLRHTNVSFLQVSDTRDNVLFTMRVPASNVSQYCSPDVGLTEWLWYSFDAWKVGVLNFRNASLTLRSMKDALQPLPAEQESLPPALQLLLTVDLYIPSTAMKVWDPSSLANNYVYDPSEGSRRLKNVISSFIPHRDVMHHSILDKVVLPDVYPFPQESEFLQPAKLAATLMPYQRRALSWMLFKEGCRMDAQQHTLIPSPGSQTFVNCPPPLFRQARDPNGQPSLLVSPSMGKVMADIPSNRSGTIAPGGLLCEEMGLGKTVMALAAILAHPRPDASAQNSVPPKDLASQIVDFSAVQDAMPKCCACPLKRKKSESTDMIQCTKCVRWFHFECLTPDIKEALSTRLFHCSTCVSELQKEEFNNPVPVNATLVISPSVIMNQWLLEAKAHAPTLKCRIYEGSETDRLLFADDINQYDVIFTSYDLLRKDVNISVADKMQDRPRRREARYTRAYSPLVRFKWWRVIMDEAQMIAKEGTKPEEMASRIPREISWAVTGTPTDVPGLLRFVDKEFSYHMYSESSYHMYSTGSGYIGSALLPFFLHRNRKDNVSKEVTIPPQTDRVLYLNFTTIERTWYDQLYETLRERQERHEAQAKDLEPEEERKHHEERARLLNEWLQQLRQTCCHPQTGSQNRRTLGTRIRTLGEVLNVMMKQASTTAAATERQYHLERIYEAHLLEFRASDADWKEGADEPLQIYKSVFKDVHATVDDIKKEIKYLEEESKKAAREDTDKSDHDSDEEGEDEDEEVQEFESLTGKLQSWQELEHRVVYFMASLYHSIRNEQLETEYYEVASRLRRQILAVAESEVNKVINRFKLTSIEPSLKKNGPMVLGKLRLNGGLRAWQMTENFQSVCDLLDGQWRTIADWRKYMTDTLLEPVEESDAPAGEVIGLDDGKETNEGGKGSEKPVPTGEEYKEGVERQSRAAIYLDWYVAALEDRRQLLTGHRATTEQSHVRNREDHVGTGGIPFTCVETELREKLRSEIDPFCLPAEEQPIRTTLMDLRRLSKDKELPEAEAATVTLTAAKVTDILQSQVSKLDLLEREVQLFRKLFNVRIAYYKQLQRISDGVVAVDRPDRLEDALKQCRETAQSLQKQVVTLNARRRYLQTINEEERERSQDQTAAAQPNETPAATIERECLICRNFFMRGILTPCGHLYCNECVVIWIDRYQKCPACNQKVKRGESTPVTLEVPVEKFVAPLRLDPVSFSSNRIEDVPIKDETSLIRQLSNIPLRGGSLGSKLDTILRHLQFIRQNDPTAKTLIFSQWENLLTILAVGMTRNKIPHVKLVNGSRAHRSDALRQFNDDPSMQVIMLNARSQSAGLTLVAANHVMLLEPVVNIGLELQAISRVHRIGQKRETTIWRYIVKSTVEERIFHLARDRRRDLRLKGKLEQASDPNAKLAKPSHGGGELVEAEDSAWCLLGDEGWDAFKAASEARVAAESRPADSEEIPPPPEYVIRQRREARQSEIIWAAMLDDGGDNTREMAPVVEEADVDEDSDSSEAAADSTEEADTSANQPATSPSTKRKRDFDSEASSAIEAPTTGVFPNPHEDSSAKSENGDKENETFGETQPELIDQNPLEGDLALHPIRSSMGSGRMGKKARGGGSRLAVGEIRLDM